VVYSLDALLYELFLCSYLLYPSMLWLVCRASSQFQFSRPREMDSTRTLRFFFFFACLVNAFPILRHVFAGLDFQSHGLLLDFVGRATPPTRVQIIFLDVAIFLLQIITLVIAYETWNPDPDVTDPLAFHSTSEPVSPSESSSSSDPLDRSTSKDAPSTHIFHLRLRTTFNRIAYPPATSQDLDIPLPNTSGRRRDNNTVGGSTIGRLWAVVQRQNGMMAAAAPIPPRPPPQQQLRIPGAMPGV